MIAMNKLKFISDRITVSRNRRNENKKYASSVREGDGTWLQQHATATIPATCTVLLELICVCVCTSCQLSMPHYIRLLHIGWHESAFYPDYTPKVRLHTIVHSECVQLYWPVG